MPDLNGRLPSTLSSRAAKSSLSTRRHAIVACNAQRVMLRSAVRTGSLLSPALCPEGTRALSSEAGVSSARAAFAYCVEQFRTYDYDNYVWAVQLPKELRAAVVALRAFNVETAQANDLNKQWTVAEQVRQAGLVPIRFQWWRDAVNSCYRGAPVKHPVVQALAQVIAETPLTRYRLQQIVNAREQDLLQPGQPAETAQLEAYAEGTASQLLYLQLEAAGVTDEASQAAASHLGKAVGMTSLLRGTAHHAQRRRCYLPSSLCAREGVTEDDVFAGNSTAGMRNVALKVAATAKGHLDDAQEMISSVAADGRRVLLPSVAAGLYLAALERHDFDLFSGALQRGGFSPLRYQLQIKWHLFRNTY